MYRVCVLGPAGKPNRRHRKTRSARGRVFIRSDRRRRDTTPRRSRGKIVRETRRIDRFSESSVRIGYAAADEQEPSMSRMSGYEVPTRDTENITCVPLSPYRRGYDHRASMWSSKRYVTSTTIPLGLVPFRRQHRSVRTTPGVLASPDISPPGLPDGRQCEPGPTPTENRNRTLHVVYTTIIRQ